MSLSSAFLRALGARVQSVGQAAVTGAARLPVSVQAAAPAVHLTARVGSSSV